MRIRTELTSILAIATVLAGKAQGKVARPLIRDISSACSTPAILDAETNVWKDHTLYPTSYYRNEVEQAVKAIDDVQIREKAAKAADVGTFIWIKTSNNITDLAKEAEAVPCNYILGLVLDSLPYKESKAPRSLGLDDGAPVQYQTSFIDSIAEVIKSSPNTAFAVIVEPYAFPAYFNDTSVGDDLAKSYRENVPYALKALDLPNVVTYIDVGNSNSMDWDRQRDVAAREMNEQQFVRILSDALRKNGLPPRATHGVMDTSRNGVPGLRWSWDDWCNVNGAGLGRRPTSQTGDERLDTFVWVAHPGESDGSSDPSGPGYDAFCGKDDALKPSPAVGQWHQVYFEMLVQNANPSQQCPNVR
ncbi:hypothetical protein Hte_009314 [Hypoxylon texense]